MIHKIFVNKFLICHLAFCVNNHMHISKRKLWYICYELTVLICTYIFCFMLFKTFLLPFSWNNSSCIVHRKQNLPLHNDSPPRVTPVTKLFCHNLCLHWDAYLKMCTDSQLYKMEYVLNFGNNPANISTICSYHLMLNLTQGSLCMKEVVLKKTRI